MDRDFDPPQPPSGETQQRSTTPLVGSTSDFALRDVVGTGWGAVLVMSLGVALLILLAVGRPDRPGVWPDAVRWAMVPGFAICLAAIAARSGGGATRGEIAVGRLCWFSVGLAFVGLGLHARSPGHGERLLLLPGALLILIFGCWLAFVPHDDTTERRTAKAGRVLRFAAGFPGRRRPVVDQAVSTAQSTPPPGYTP